MYLAKYLKSKYFFVLSIFVLFAVPVLGRDFSSGDIQALTEAIKDYEQAVSAQQDQTNQAVANLGLPRRIDVLNDLVRKIEVGIAEGRSDVQHLIKQLEGDHSLIMKNSDGLLNLGDRVLVLEGIVPDNRIRIIDLEKTRNQNSEEVKGMIISFFSSTVGIIGSVMVVILTAVKLYLTYVTNKKTRN